MSNQNLVTLRAWSNTRFHFTQQLTQLTYLDLANNPILPYAQLELIMPQLKRLDMSENLRISTPTRLTKLLIGLITGMHLQVTSTSPISTN